MAQMKGPNPAMSAQQRHEVVSNVVRKKEEELLELPPSVERELQMQFWKATLNATSPVPGRSSTQEGKEKASKWYSKFKPGRTWRKIQGATRWKDLLDPIDEVLRAEILRYGELTHVTYDAFEDNRHAENYGKCKYERSELFEKVDLDPGYTVTDYLYATAQLDFPDPFVSSRHHKSLIKVTRWMGYVAVTTSPEEIARLGRRDILVAWRGTGTRFEWIKNLQCYAVPAHFGEDDSVQVPRGLLNIYTSRDASENKSVQEQVRSAIKKLLERYKHEELSITITGHSLGSALATLCAYDLSASDLNTVFDDLNVPNFTSADEVTGAKRRIPITVFSFAGPRVGNRELQRRLEERGVAVIRVVNAYDMVTQVPYVVFRCGQQGGQLEEDKGKSARLLVYHHVGVKFEIDHNKSPFLETKILLSCIRNQKNFHSLEAYLHLVDGFQGSSVPFRKELLRPFHLVNKRGNFLKLALGITPKWSRGMKRNEEWDEGEHSYQFGDAKLGKDENDHSSNDGRSKASDGIQGKTGIGVEVRLWNGSGVQIDHGRIQYWGAAEGPRVQTGGGQYIDTTIARHEGGVSSNGNRVQNTGKLQHWGAVEGPSVQITNGGQYIDTAVARHEGGVPMSENGVQFYTGRTQHWDAAERPSVQSAWGGHGGGQYTTVSRCEGGVFSNGNVVQMNSGRIQHWEAPGGPWVQRASGGQWVQSGSEGQYIDTAIARHQDGIPTKGQWAVGRECQCSGLDCADGGRRSH